MNTSYKKIWQRILILLLVFLAAVVINFIWSGSRKDDTEAEVYSAMEAPTIPVVYPRMLGREMAPLFGHLEEGAVTADRDSLLVMSEDRQLGIRIDNAWEMESLRYEIRSLDMEHLVERTELSGWKIEEGGVTVDLPIQNLLDKETQYLLAINIDLYDGRSLWYYTRIVETDNEHVEEMLELAEEFSLKSLDYEAAQDLTMYMESSQSADNSSYGSVNLKNSFDMITWGDLEVERESEPFIMLRELSGDLADVELDYVVRRTAESDTGTRSVERFIVREIFTLKWSTQRIFMMDFEREMNEIFTGSRDLFTGRRILMGINSGDDLYAKKNSDGSVVAFVVNHELWEYDSRKEAAREGLFSRDDARSILVFTFEGDYGSDARTDNSRHGIEILEVSDDGDIDFLVYGYMNRGRHEGATGISYYSYDPDENLLEELFFLPANENYEELRKDIELLAHRGDNDILYLYMNGSIYGIDLTSFEYVIVASGLTDDKFAVSYDGSRVAWQEDTGAYDSRTLYIMDLDTGEKDQLAGKDGEVLRILGFVGNDCVYGTGDAGDYIMSNGRIEGLFLKRLDILDRDMNIIKSYSKNNSWISSVEVEESRIHIELVKDKSEGFFAASTSDTLVCNDDVLPGRMDEIGWYASGDKGRIYFVQLDSGVNADDRIRSVSPDKLAVDDSVDIVLENDYSHDSVEFFAYGRGKYLGRYVNFADAADAAYDSMGFVSLGRDETVWERANKPNSANIRDYTTAIRRLERNTDDFENGKRGEDESLMIDLSGATLNQVLFFVGNGMPVLAYTGVGEGVYLIGYDRTSVRIYDPGTGSTATWELDDAEDYFERLGNDFIVCVYSQ